MKVFRKALGVLILVNILPLIIGSTFYFAEGSFIKNYLFCLLSEVISALFCGLIWLGIYLVSGINIFIE